MISVKNERSSANHVTFDEVIQIFIILVEDRKVGLLCKVVEQVEQGQTRYADALFEHVYATLLIEGTIYVDGLQKGNQVPIVVPDEKASQCRHAVLVPGFLTTGVTLIGNALVLQPLQTVHVLVRDIIFRHLASVCFQIRVVAESRGYVIGHV